MTINEEAAATPAVDYGRDTFLTKRLISIDEAREAFKRFENRFWRRDPGPTISIPARPDSDDDLILAAYFAQHELAAAQSAELLAVLSQSLAILDALVKPDMAKSSGELFFQALGVSTRARAVIAKADDAASKIARGG